MQISEGDIIGAVKIKDALFIGDELASQDLEFVVTNKVTHIINCAGKQIQNHWEPIGVIYLTFNWQETDYQVLFDAKDDVLNEIYRFIENAMVKGESVLIHSLKGQNRSCCVLAAYFMKKYRWTLYKTLEFLHSRKPNLEIRSNFFSQLMNLENRLAKLGHGAKTYNWNEVGDDPKNIESEELLLTNTFLNSKKAALNEGDTVEKKDGRTRIVFSEHNSVQHHPKEKKFNSALAASDGFQLNKREKDTNPGKAIIKSILKGSGKVFQLRPATEGGNPIRGSTKEGVDSPTTIAGQIKRPAILPLSPDANGVPGLRPLSGGGLGIRPLSGHKGIKELHSPGALEKSGDGSAGLQGNIIHITVNNYITNTNVTNDIGSASAKSSSSNKINLEDKGRMGLTNSNSSKELSLGSIQNDKLFGKRGFSPSAALDKQNGTAAPKGFGPLVTANDYKKKSLVNTLDGDDSPIARNNRFKVVNSSSNKASLAVYGNQNMTKTLGQLSDRKTIGGFRSMNSTQPLERERELAVTGSNNLSIKSNQGEYRTPAYYKYLNAGQGGPIKPTLDFKSKDSYESDPYNQMMSSQGMLSQKEKLGARPVTAPEQKASNSMKNSPYLSTAMSSSFQPSRKGRTLDSSQGPRQGSIQPSKDSSAFAASMKSRMRSSSPAQPKSTPFNYFQEISNKPRWKF